MGDLTEIKADGEGKMKAPLRKKIRRVGVIAAVICILMVGAYGGYKVGAWLAQDKKAVSVEDIREELTPVAQLATYEYSFTEIMHLSDSHRILNFEVPFTEKHYVATVEGAILIGIEDVEKIEYALSTGFDGNVKSVTVALPHCEAWKATIDHASLEVLVDLDGVANNVTKEELNDLYINIEEKQKAKAGTDGVLTKADERLQNIVTAQAQALYGDTVEVVFEYKD